MPCNSDYMEPNDAEVNSRDICEHIVYLQAHIGFDIPDWVKIGAADYYGAPTRIDEATEMLCQICGNLEKNAPGVADELIYNGRRREARRLADWWDEHKEADRAAGRR